MMLRKEIKGQYKETKNYFLVNSTKMILKFRLMQKENEMSRVVYK